jgi:hypothetical protein
MHCNADGVCDDCRRAGDQCGYAHLAPCCAGTNCFDFQCEAKTCGGVQCSPGQMCCVTPEQPDGFCCKDGTRCSSSEDCPQGFDMRCCVAQEQTEGVCCPGLWYCTNGVCG